MIVIRQAIKHIIIRDKLQSCEIIGLSQDGNRE